MLIVICVEFKKKIIKFTFIRTHLSVPKDKSLYIHLVDQIKNIRLVLNSKNNSKKERLHKKTVINRKKKNVL